MVMYILAAVLLALALAGVVVRKTYFQLPLRELKRRAARHDAVAERMYRVVAYGNSAKALLWLLIGLTAAASIVLLARVLPVWVSLLIVAPLLWVVFSLVPATRVTRLGARLALYATPTMAYVLNYLHPVLNRAADQVEQRYVAAGHTRLYERDDLLELIERQKRQLDSRFTPEELEIATRALQFGEKTVGDSMTSRTAIKTVLADDTVGPVLIDELHKTGQDFALVRESKKGPFVGALAIKQLGLKSSGRVSDLMVAPVYYLHEDDTLSQALHAFFVTNHPVFVVVNGFEEYVGVLSVDDVLQQLLGHIPGDDFDQYADPAAVAARHAKGAPAEETSVKTETEVVE